MNNLAPLTMSKRTRGEALEEDTPSGKRCRTFDPVHAIEQPQAAPPTANFSSTLAQRQQQALERMEVGAAERTDVEMEMEMDGNMSDESSTSNPRHPWNVAAPAMTHQASSNSLSSSSVASSSMPGTPLDGAFNYANYPSNSNPTSFTDMNGNTLSFGSSSPPLSDNASNSNVGGPISHGFVAQAYANAQAKQQPGTIALSGRNEASQGETMMTDREAEQPEVRPVQSQPPTYGYGWDYPRQSNCFALGGHLV
ncbi:hypothetical protein JCM16303_001306 [Sporobolomyces ruberrimus]